MANGRPSRGAGHLPRKEGGTMPVVWRVKLYMGVETRVGAVKYETSSAAVQAAVLLEDGLKACGFNDVCVGVAYKEAEGGRAKEGKDDV